MAVVTIKQLLESGVHFGHQTQRWNPRMAPYLYGDRNQIHIIDLRKTAALLEEAAAFVRDVSSKGGSVLFVGTKKQVQGPLAEEADRAGQPYVNYRWLGGMLTNFRTIQKRIFYMKELIGMEESGEMEALPKKERLRLRRELEKLQRNLGGVANLQHLPAAVFVVDLNQEQIALTEARRLNIPIIGLVDSNCDPTLVDYVVPGNDDAVRSAQLVASVIADAVIAGKAGIEESELVAETQE